jgi:DNA-binding PadR family transcriptional regulator
MAPRRIPKLTHLQFVVLGLLRDGEQPGRAIRDAIAAHGVKRSAPAFYQLMARLERDRLVDGWYEQVTAGDQAVTERRYRLRAAGAKLWAETRDFYSTLIARAEDRPSTKLRTRWSDA